MSRNWQLALVCRFALPAFLALIGALTVRCHFAETAVDDPDARLFDVAVNGQKILNGFDIDAAAGGQKDRAVIRDATVNAKADGSIEIDFDGDWRIPGYSPGRKVIKMFKHRELYFVVALAACFTPMRGNCSDTPPKLVEARSAMLDHVNLDWAYRKTADKPDETARWLNKDINDDKIEGSVEAQSQGISDPSQIKKIIDAKIAMDTALDSGFRFEFTGSWTTQTDGDTTLVKGSSQSSPTYIGNTTIISGTNYAITVDDGAEYLPARQAQPKGISYIYSTPGPGWSQRDRLGSRIGLGPEEYAMLLGRNPFDINGLSWAQTNATPTTWTFESDMASGVPHPLHLVLKIDRQYCAPISLVSVDNVTHIVVKSITASKFQQYGATWLPAAVAEERDTFGTVERESWNLLKVNAPQKINIPLVHGASIADYRLISDISQVSFFTIATGKDDRIVYYPWTGSLLSLDDLRKIHDIQRPNSGSKTTGSSAAMGILGLSLSVMGIGLLRRKA